MAAESKAAEATARANPLARWGKRKARAKEKARASKTKATTRKANKVARVANAQKARASSNGTSPSGHFMVLESHR